MTLDELLAEARENLELRSSPGCLARAHFRAAGYLEGVLAAKRCSDTFESRNDLTVHPVNADGSF